MLGKSENSEFKLFVVSFKITVSNKSVQNNFPTQTLHLKILSNQSETLQKLFRVELRPKRPNAGNASSGLMPH